MWVRLGFLSLLLAFFVGCAVDVPDSDYGFGSGGPVMTTGLDESDSEDGTGTDSGGETSGGIADLPDTKLDVAIPGDVGEEICDEIDFLFVIDNSGSMQDNQMNLINNFPQFANNILGLFPNQDYHVGVITTDPYQYNEPGCQKLGALVTQTGGYNMPMDICGPYADGYNFMTKADDLVTTFTCAANVGTYGSGNEQPLQAMVNALEGFMNSPGQCNESFFRPDALLVLVFITDEDEHVGDAQNYYDHLVWLKGDPTEVVVLTLGVENANQGCGYQTSDTLIEFTNKFFYGVVGDVCAPDYGPFFQGAVGWIATACGYPPVE